MTSYLFQLILHEPPAFIENPKGYGFSCTLILYGHILLPGIHVLRIILLFIGSE